MVASCSCCLVPEDGVLRQLRKIQKLVQHMAVLPANQSLKGLIDRQ